MAVPLENCLLVHIKGNQSHDELMRRIQVKQDAAPIRKIGCYIYDHEEEFGIQHPFFSFIQNTPTLEEVEFNCYGKGKASVDAFLDAVSQNHSIHTVDLYQIDCSAYAIQKLME